MLENDSGYTKESGSPPKTVGDQDFRVLSSLPVVLGDDMSSGFCVIVLTYIHTPTHTPTHPYIVVNRPIHAGDYFGVSKNVLLAYIIICSTDETINTRSYS